jgi:hypothetical protein
LLSLQHLQSEAAAAHAYAMNSPSLSSYSGASTVPPLSSNATAAATQQQLAASLSHAHALSTSAAAARRQREDELASLELDAQIHALSATAGGAQAAGDVSRVQVLLRLLEIEKRVARSDERARMQEDATKLRIAELVSSNAQSAERSAAFLQRVSEAELVAKECALTVSSVEARVGREGESLQLLRNTVATWRDEVRKELRDELARNITLRNATHHAELVGLMDKQQEQAAKIIRAHELTSQAFAAKLAASEAEHKAQFEALEARLAAQENQARERREQHDTHVEQRLSELAAQLAATQQAQHQLIERTVPALQAAVDALRAQEGQHGSQLSTQQGALQNLSAQVEAQGSSLLERLSALERAQLNVQNSVMAVGDGMAANLTDLRSELGDSARRAAEEAHARHSHLDQRQQHVEQQVHALERAGEEGARAVEQVRKAARRATLGVQMVEEQLAQIQAKVLVANESATAAAVAAWGTATAGVQGSPLAQTTVRPLHASPLQSSRLTFASPSAPPAASASPLPAAASSVPHPSPFPSVPAVPTPSLFGLQMHMSDAAGLRISSPQAAAMHHHATRHSHNQRHTPHEQQPYPQQQRHRGATQSPQRDETDMRNGAYAHAVAPNSSAEEEFVANFLAGASL